MEARLAGEMESDRILHSCFNASKRRLLRSAGFQPAVSPTSSRQTVGKTEVVWNGRALRVGNPRYSRLEVCATMNAGPDYEISGLDTSLRLAGRGRSGSRTRGSSSLRRSFSCQPALPGRARHSVRAVWRCSANRATHHIRGGQGTARPTGFMVPMHAKNRKEAPRETPR